MRIFVKVKPGSQTEKVEQLSGQEYAVWVKEPAKENKANHAVLRVLAEYFGITLARLALVSGRASRNKIVEISE